MATISNSIITLTFLLSFSSSGMEQFLSSLAQEEQSTIGTIFTELVGRMNHFVTIDNIENRQNIEREVNEATQSLKTFVEMHPVLSPADKKRAIFGAARYGNRQMINLLLNAECSIEERESKLQTPLMAAAYYGNLETVQTLLEKGADIHKKDRDGRTAKDYALLIFEQLQDLEQVPFYFRTHLLVASHYGNFDPQNLENNAFVKCAAFLEIAEQLHAAERRQTEQNSSKIAELFSSLKNYLASYFIAI